MPPKTYAEEERTVALIEKVYAQRLCQQNHGRYHAFMDGHIDRDLRNGHHVALNEVGQVLSMSTCTSKTYL